MKKALSFDEKIRLFSEKFTALPSDEARYGAIIEMGRGLPPLFQEEKTEETRVHGCQSRLYLVHSQEGNLFFFRAEADALISAGLAALLCSIYSGETAQTILLKQPTFLSSLGILTSLSPSRSNGLLQIYRAMQKKALH